MNAAVQTSAQQPEVDLFGDTVHPPSDLVEVTGTLEHDAQVRIQASDHGHARPVLCIDLVDVGPGLRRVHVELPFDHTSRFAADAMASQLKRGTRVSTGATFAGSTLTLPHAAYIKPTEKATA